MEDTETGQYERTRTRRAKYLASEYLSYLDSVAKKDPDAAEVVSLSNLDLRRFSNQRGGFFPARRSAFNRVVALLYRILWPGFL